MIVEFKDGVYRIRRGVAYFCFFVDSTGASWSSSISQARRFDTREDAERELTMLRERNAEVARRRRGWAYS